MVSVGWQRYNTNIVNSESTNKLIVTKSIIIDYSIGRMVCQFYYDKVYTLIN